MSRKRHDYKSVVHAVIQTSCHMGEELHTVTSNAYGSRVLNLRMSRVIPSKTGHTGYTKVGFFLTKEEAKKLRDALIDLSEKDEAWETDGGEWHEMGDD